MGKKLSYEFIKKQFEKRGYKLLSINYINDVYPLKFLCDIGHETTITYNNFRSGRGCSLCGIKRRSGKNHPNWRGGATKKKIALYSTYAHQLDFCEDVRRDPDNYDILQVRCSESNCREWFSPNRLIVDRRVRALKNQIRGDSNFYCSNECKNNCSIFGQKRYPKNFKPDYSRELQPELRGLVLQRDEHECQRCGNTSDLQCHHFEGLNINPIESADIDNCITLCSECHKMAHEDEGCRYVDIKKYNLCVGVGYGR